MLMTVSAQSIRRHSSSSDGVVDHLMRTRTAAAWPHHGFTARVAQLRTVGGAITN